MICDGLGGRQAKLYRLMALYSVTAMKLQMLSIPSTASLSQPTPSVTSDVYLIREEGEMQTVRLHLTLQTVMDTQEPLKVALFATWFCVPLLINQSI